jgi:hypothetical protein
VSVRSPAFVLLPVSSFAITGWLTFSRSASRRAGAMNPLGIGSDYQSIDTRTSFDEPLSPSTLIPQSRF